MDATVTVQVAVLLPSTVLTVIVAVPAATAVTRPLLFTEAILLLLLLQVTFLLVAFDGAMVGVNCSVLPAVNEVEILFKDTPVTDMVAAFTVTEQVAVLLPSTVVTVIVALPVAIAVTNPLLFTVATLELLETQDTFLFVALDGAIVAVSCSVPPTVNEVEVLFNDTLVTDIVAAVTVTEQVAVLLPSEVLTVMVVVPTATAVTRPLLLTVATFELLEVHDTALLVALDGDMVGVNCSVLPTANEVEVLFKVTPVTAIVDVFAVTVQEAVLLPSSVLTVIVAVPVAFAVTKPDVLTVAIFVLLLLHVTFLLAAFEG